MVFEVQIPIKEEKVIVVVVEEEGFHGEKIKGLKSLREGERDLVDF